jgi:hypothetical protein
MDTELELSTGLIPGVRTFRASANAPGGIAAIQLLDASGNDVSAFHDVRNTLGVSPVPEPEAYAMLLVGLVALRTMRAARVQRHRSRG